MKSTEIVRINEKGELTIPEEIRDSVGIVEGMHVMMKTDLERREIRIIPFTTAEVDLVEFTITLADVPGALGKCATFLGEHKINMMASESKILQSGEIAEWIIVADISKCKENIRDLCKRIVDEGYAKKSICRSFQ